MTNINEKILTDSGLTQDQAKIYLFLLENGMANAKSISLKTGLGRALTYKVIDQLIASNLVEKRDVGKIARFFPSHPQAIKSMAETRKRESAAASESLNTVFGSLASSYNMLLGKPNIQFHEGVEGIERIYEDILETGQDIFLISSPLRRPRGRFTLDKGTDRAAGGQKHPNKGHHAPRWAKNSHGNYGG
jgi:sugar-specific transcriptional regulator TrmB